MTEEKQQQAPGNTMVAVVLVRGLVGVTQKIKDTLSMLRLTRKNFCVVIADTPTNRGMLQKAKDYITWGPIDDATYKVLVEKRGEEFLSRLTDSKNTYSYKSLDVDGKKYKPYFRLNPPTKGFGRKGIKMPFKLGGALGNRGDAMADLIKRMV